MYGWAILCGISKGKFEIPHKIPYSYIERYDFYTLMKIYKLYELRTHLYFQTQPFPHTYSQQFSKKQPSIEHVLQMVIASFTRCPKEMQQ